MLTISEKMKIEVFATNFAKEVEAYIIATYEPKFTLSTIKLDWSPNRVSSKGGLYKNGPGISIAMIALRKSFYGETYRYYEYPSYDKDPVIGGFYSKEYNDLLKAMICHEISHALQFYVDRILNVRGRSAPHGIEFKTYYKNLRQVFVNKYLPEQEPLKTNYNNYIKSITI